MDGFKKGLTHLKKKLTTLSRDSDDFSDSFLANKSALKRSRVLVEDLMKETREYAAAGREFALAQKKMAQTLEELAKELASGPTGTADDPPLTPLSASSASSPALTPSSASSASFPSSSAASGSSGNAGQWPVNSTALAHLQQFAEHRAEMANTLYTMVDEVEKILSGYIDQISKDIRDARASKKRCYQAYEEREALKVKLLGMANTKTEASIWLDAQQVYRASAVKFSQSEIEAIAKIEDVLRYKNICFLECFDYIGRIERGRLSEILTHDAQNTENVSQGFPSIKQYRAEYEAEKATRILSGTELSSPQKLRDRASLPIINAFSVIEDGEPPPFHAAEEIIFQARKVICITNESTSNVGILFCTNYRLVFSGCVIQEDNLAGNRSSRLFKPREESSDKFVIPLMSVERVEKLDSDKKMVVIWCKDCRTYTLSFRLSDENFDQIFQQILQNSMKFVEASFALNSRQMKNPIPSEFEGWKLYDPKSEYERQGVFKNPAWRLSSINTSYDFCPTYPSFFVVPSSVSDDDLLKAAEFRSKSRVPVLSWLSPSGCPIVRGSQPLVGLKRMHSLADQGLLRQYIFATQATRLVVCDARPRVNAVANAAVGGGWEDSESYPFCAVEFFSIENIHAVREAFAHFRGLISVAEGKNAEDSISGKKLDWLKINLQVLNGAARVYQLIESKVPVFVHCSDGWDRTAQITSLAQLMMDPYYRTTVGFMVLIEKEWISFGHQFARRFGHGVDRLNFSDSQRSPIFFQWLECVWHILSKAPDLFEFDESLLEFILHHVTSCRFGTFLCNSEKERREKRIREKAYSIWSIVLFHKDSFTNRSYSPGDYPISSFTNLKFWPAYGRLGSWLFEMLSI